ncbi:hypothetical protein [Montanilutibacter psychrotolerans]|uniref:hypothetical protein n=1 Tax=Montanilutibacter psychrotolerans TaxID=1327343 RepID=UPI00167FEBDA|nr:hypothetical protein [Lysobacter psychrotolerans]
MTTRFTLRTMALLLRQGRRLNALSWLLLALAGGWLVIAASGQGTLAGGSLPWLLVSVSAGLLQLYHAVRVDLDADLLEALSEAGGAPGGSDEDVADASARTLDASLQSLGLQPPSGGGRDWRARWRGARRLLLWQSAWLLAQWVSVGLALWSASS